MVPKICPYCGSRWLWQATSGLRWLCEDCKKYIYEEQLREADQ